MESVVHEALLQSKHRTLNPEVRVWLLIVCVCVVVVVGGMVAVGGGNVRGALGARMLPPAGTHLAVVGRTRFNGFNGLPAHNPFDPPFGRATPSASSQCPLAGGRLFLHSCLCGVRAVAGQECVGEGGLGRGGRHGEASKSH